MGSPRVAPTPMPSGRRERRRGGVDIVRKEFNEELSLTAHRFDTGTPQYQKRHSRGGAYAKASRWATQKGTYIFLRKQKLSPGS